MRKFVRPDEAIKGTVTVVQTGLGKLYVTVNTLDDGIPIEVFCTIGKSGSAIMVKAEVIGRLVTLALQYGVPVPDIVEQLLGMQDEHPRYPFNGQLVKSIPDAVGLVLERYYLQKGGDTHGSGQIQKGQEGCQEGDESSPQTQSPEERAVLLKK